jgi:hypothetical protein
MISRGSGQFWVLRDAAGAGLIVALAPLPNPARFSEVRGPRNAAIAHDNADLALLAQALGAALSGPRPHFPRADADIEAMLEWLRNENALVPPLRRQAGQP